MRSDVAHVTHFDSNQIVGWVSKPGTYLLRVNYTPYWSIAHATACVSRARDSSTLLTVRVAGRFSLRAIETPLGVLAASVDGDGVICQSR